MVAASILYTFNLVGSAIKTEKFFALSPNALSRNVPLSLISFSKVSTNSAVLGQLVLLSKTGLAGNVLT